MTAAEPGTGPVTAAVVFDLDGVIVETEHLWEESWAACAREHGAAWGRADTLALQGMSSTEWSRALARHITAAVGTPVDAERVRESCVARVRGAVASGNGPLLPGADTMLRRVAAAVPVALASSAARPVIDTVLEQHGVAGLFAATVSSEEVPRGKPAPDVYTEALHRMGAAPLGAPGVRAEARLAVEDSGNGIRAAHAAGLRVVAIPNPEYPPAEDALRLASHIATDHDDATRYLLSALSAADRPPDDPSGRLAPG